MTIRNQLTLLYTVITASILFLFALVIYFLASQNREKEFFTALKKEAVTKANLFFDAKIKVKILQDIYRNNRSILNEVEVAIYDSSFSLLYHDAVDIDFVKESKSMIEKIFDSGDTVFYQNDWQVVGMLFNHKGKKFVVTAAAFDLYGYKKLKYIFNIEIIIFNISIIIIYISGWIFSRKAFKPVKEMADKTKIISASKLDLRLNINKGNDEISYLANTFDEMLNRLENSFKAQKQFVSNISHELRTPLSALITELELSTNRERKIEDYKEVIGNALIDARKMAKLSNSLLDLAKADYDPSQIHFKQIRIDEILLDARQEVLRFNTEFKIDIFFERDIENEHEISINGNEYLLKVAFSNLIENGCKFSEEKECKVYISFKPNLLSLSFRDNGKGINKQEVDEIFEPFFRGRNGRDYPGSGIGLSLTKKIILLHHGVISLKSNEEIGNTFIISLPN